MGLLLGFDLGTTVIKAALFDAVSGELAALAHREIPLAITPDGGRMQRPAAILTLLEAIACELRLDERPIEGIGIASQGGSSLLLESKTTSPTTPLYLWNDGRMAGHQRRLAEASPPDFWRKRGLNDYPPHGLARIAWLHEVHPEVFAGHPFHAGLGDYLVYCLTGVWRQDPGHAIQTGAYNAATDTLDETIFSRAGLPLSAVAPLRAGHETSPLSSQGASLLGLGAGIPVAGPYIDQEAAWMSIAARAAAPLQVSLGTAWVGNFALPEGQAGFAPNQLSIRNPLYRGKLVILPLRTGNTAWDWALAQGPGDEATARYAWAEDVFAQALLPPAGLYHFPWFTLPHLSEAGATGAGVLCGLNAQSGHEAILRATAAGLACEFYRIFAAVHAAGFLKEIVLCGGAAHAPAFRTLFAALFAPLPIYVLKDEDTAAARGAIYAFHTDVARAPLKPLAPPDAETSAAVRRYYEGYLACHNTLFSDSPGGAPYTIEGKQS